MLHSMVVKQKMGEMRKILGRKFFDRPAEEVAPELLGKFLVRRVGQREIVAMITEVEAYTGAEDLACHAHCGKTARNAPTFAPPGRWYVYFCYGMHWILNAVTGPGANPSAVLIRGVQNVSGPGRLTARFRIGKAFNNATISPAAGLWIEDRSMLALA